MRINFRLFEIAVCEGLKTTEFVVDRPEPPRAGQRGAAPAQRRYVGEERALEA